MLKLPTITPRLDIASDPDLTVVDAQVLPIWRLESRYRSNGGALDRPEFRTPFACGNPIQRCLLTE